MDVTVYLKSGNTVYAEYAQENLDDGDLADVLLDPGVGMIVFQGEDNELLIPKDNIDYVKVHNVQ